MEEKHEEKAVEIREEVVMSPIAMRPRKQLLSGISVTERRLQVAGISTAAVEGKHI